MWVVLRKYTPAGDRELVKADLPRERAEAIAELLRAEEPDYEFEVAEVD